MAAVAQHAQDIPAISANAEMFVKALAIHLWDFPGFCFYPDFPYPSWKKQKNNYNLLTSNKFNYLKLNLTNIY